MAPASQLQKMVPFYYFYSGFKAIIPYPPNLSPPAHSSWVLHCWHPQPPVGTSCLIVLACASLDREQRKRIHIFIYNPCKKMSPSHHVCAHGLIWVWTRQSTRVLGHVYLFLPQFPPPPPPPFQDRRSVVLGNNSSFVFPFFLRLIRIMLGNQAN